MLHRTNHRRLFFVCQKKLSLCEIFKFQPERFVNLMPRLTFLDFMIRRRRLHFKGEALALSVRALYRYLIYLRLVRFILLLEKYVLASLFPNSITIFFKEKFLFFFVRFPSIGGPVNQRCFSVRA